MNYAGLPTIDDEMGVVAHIRGPFGVHHCGIGIGDADEESATRR